MRMLVVTGLVIFHSAVVFAAGASWFVKDPRPDAGFTAFLLWGSLWGMPLLFLVSGMGVRYALRTRSAGSFARERLARLGVPFAAGLVVLVPPLFYLERLGQPGFHEPYWRFWLGFVNLPALARGLLPDGTWASGGVTYDPAHLWFLYVLLLYSVALLPLLGYLRGPRGTRPGLRGTRPNVSGSGSGTRTDPRRPRRAGGTERDSRKPHARTPDALTRPGRDATISRSPCAHSSAG